MKSQNSFSKKDTGKYLTYLLFIILKKIIQNLNKNIKDILQKILTYGFYYAGKKWYKVFKKNIEIIFPQYTNEQKNKLFFNISKNLITTFFDFLIMENRVDEYACKVRIVDENQIKLLLSDYKKSQGIIFVSGHLGNWEMMPYFFKKKYDIFLRAVAKPMRNFYIEEEIDKIRKSMDSNAFTFGERNAVLQIIKHLKKGNAAAFLVDQDIGKVSIKTKFFNKSVCTIKSPFELALKLNIPLYAAFNIKTETGYDLHIYKLYKNENLISLMDEFNRYFEKFIEKYPANWFCWLHRRFKTAGVKY